MVTKFLCAMISGHMVLPMSVCHHHSSSVTTSSFFLHLMILHTLVFRTKIPQISLRFSILQSRLLLLKIENDCHRSTTLTFDLILMKFWTGLHFIVLYPTSRSPLKTAGNMPAGSIGVIPTFLVSWSNWLNQLSWFWPDWTGDWLHRFQFNELQEGTTRKLEFTGVIRLDRLLCLLFLKPHIVLNYFR